MSLSKEYIEAVEGKDLLSIRLQLKNSLIIDPTGDSFSEMLDYASKRIPNLMDKHDGEEFRNACEWDKDYYNEQTVKVVNNFSLERCELLKKMAILLFSRQNDQTSIKRGTYDDNTSIKTIKDENTSKQTNSSGRKVVGECLAVIGAGMIIGGIVISDIPIAVPILGGLSLGAGACLIFRR